jgi:hypothetical protein
METHRVSLRSESRHSSVAGFHARNSRVRLASNLDQGGVAARLTPGSGNSSRVAGHAPLATRIVAESVVATTEQCAQPIDELHRKEVNDVRVRVVLRRRSPGSSR